MDIPLRAVIAGGTAAALLGLGAASLIYKQALAPPKVQFDASALTRTISDLQNSMTQIEQQLAADDRLIKAWAAAVQRLRNSEK